MSEELTEQKCEPDDPAPSDGSECEYRFCPRERVCFHYCHDHHELICMSELTEQQIRELRAGIAEPPWTACEYMADNPIVSRSDGQTLVMLMWPTHPPEETSRIETEGYATLDFIARAPEAIDFLLAKLDETTRKAHQLCYLAGSMMLACKRLANLKKSHAHAPMIPYEKGCACPMCDITLPDFSDEAINKLAEESDAAFAQHQKEVL